jgi:hypothetical protein
MWLKASGQRDLDPDFGASYEGWLTFGGKVSF